MHFAAADSAGGAADVERVASALVSIAAATVRAEAGGPPPGRGQLPPLEPSPLARLAELAGLWGEEIAVLRLLGAAALHCDAYRALLRLCSDPQPGGIGCDGLVTAGGLLGCDPAAVLAAIDPASSLVSRGLVVLTGSSHSLAARAILPPRVIAWLRDGGVPPVAHDSALVLRHPVPRERLCELGDRDRPGVTAAGRMRELVTEALCGRAPWIVGPRGVGRRTVLATIAAESGRALLCIEGAECAAMRFTELVALLHREAILVQALICVHARAPRPDAPDPDWPALHDRLRRAGVPAVWISESPPTLGDFEQPPVLVRVGKIGVAERVAMWRSELADHPRELASELAGRYALRPGRIARAAELARELAAGRGEPLALDHVARSISLLVEQQVSVLGTRIEGEQSWDDVVLPGDTLAGVREMISRVRWRHRVLEEWGFRRKLGKGLGVAALFYGPPGTGKTLVASLIARELGLELYQIDLASVVSKWVGETEQNLARVFDAAEGANVLLLFDEADSLFSKRTSDVRSATDRHANTEVNYLLQRIERFEGVSILTTNLEGAIDPAFKRRLAFRIQFPIPDAHERAELWQRMMPREASVAGRLDFDELATAYEISGGHIKNAVLRAAYLAAGDGRAIAMTDLTRAVQLEYHDAGKLSATGRID